jgi:hypothetical protein
VVVDKNSKFFRTASLPESPTTRRAGGLDFSAIGGKKQRHDSALIGAGLKTPNQPAGIFFISH